MKFSNMNHWYCYQQDQEIKHCLYHSAEICLVKTSISLYFVKSRGQFSVLLLMLSVTFDTADLSFLP